MTRLVLLAAVASVLLGRAPAPAGEQCGDADGNGAITVLDGVQTLRAAAELSSTCTLARCDVDDGGTITLSDGVNVLRAAAELPATLDCPDDVVPACTTATVTVALAVSAPLGAGDLVLAYASAVTLPGSGDAAAARVTILTAAPLFGDGEPNDEDDRVRFTLVSLDGVASGPLLAVRFDCAGTATPEADDFTCAITGTTAPDGTPIEASCSVTVATE